MWHAAGDTVYVCMRLHFAGEQDTCMILHCKYEVSKLYNIDISYMLHFIVDSDFVLNGNSSIIVCIVT